MGTRPSPGFRQAHGWTALVGCAVALLVCCPPSGSEEVVGKRVRIDLAHGVDLLPELRDASSECGLRCRRIEGRLADIAANGALIVVVQLFGRDTVVAIPADAVTGLVVSRGQHSRERRSRRGMLLGALLGGAIGAAVGNAAHDPCEPDPDPDRWSICLDLFPWSTAVGHGAAGALIGASAGAVIGRLSPVERWERVPGFARRPSAEVRFGPVRGRGAAVSLRLTF